MKGANTRVCQEMNDDQFVAPGKPIAVDARCNPVNREEIGFALKKKDVAAT
jgi:hypothetical protein